MSDGFDDQWTAAEDAVVEDVDEMDIREAVDILTGEDEG